MTVITWIKQGGRKYPQWSAAGAGGSGGIYWANTGTGGAGVIARPKRMLLHVGR